MSSTIRIKLLKRVSRFFLSFGDMRWSLSIILISYFTSYSQSPVFHNYDAEEGLVGRVVYDIMFDSSHHLWVATSSGISRFNGTSFVNLTTEDGLVDNEVLKIVEDRKNRIWLITFSGRIVCYTKKKFKDGYNLLHEIELGIKEVPLNFFEQDEEGNIWLLTSSKIIKISENGKVKIINDQNFNFLRHFWINEATKDKFVFDQSAGILKLEDNKWKTFIEYSDQKLTSKRLFTTKSGVILELAGKNCIFNGESIKPYSKGGNTNWEEQINLILDKNNILWNCTANGAFGYAENGQIYSILEEFNITDITVDNEGGYWVGTKENGLYYSPNLKVKTYSGKNYSNTRPSCLALSKKGKIIVGYRDGTTVNLKDLGTTKKKSSVNLSNNNPIYQIAPSKQGFWIASNSEIIYKSNKNEKTIIKSIGNKDISDDGNGVIAVAKYNGVNLIRYDPLLKYYQCSTVSDTLFETILDERSFAVHFVNESELWISGQSGVYIYKNDQLTKFAHNKLFQSQSIKRIASSDSGIIGFASQSGGVFIWNQDSLYHIDKEHGLPSSVIRNLYFNKNDLWLATTKGLSKMSILNKSPLRYSIVNMDISNGLPSNDVYDVCVKNDTLYAACSKGIVSGLMSQMITNTFNFPLKIIEIKINSKSINWKELEHFKHSQNNVEIHFGAVAFRKFGKLLYRYRLKGHNSEWNYTHEGKVKYSSLNPGKYSFELELQNSANQWVKCNEKIEFEITAPFWKNAWFIIMMGVIILAIFLIFFSIWVKNVRNRERVNNQLIRRILELRHQALRSQMNPHFIFNSLNAMQKLFLEGETDKGSDYMADFASLLRMILENSEKNVISIEEDLEILNLYLSLEKGRLENSIEYQVNIDTSLDIFSTYIPPLMMQPIVENAIWHGLAPNGGGKISISYGCLQDKRIKCVIEDNGIGYEKSMEQKKMFTAFRDDKHNGKGMKILEERLEGKQYLQIEETKPRGTKITLYIKALVK